MFRSGRRCGLVFSQDGEESRVDCSEDDAELHLSIERALAIDSLSLEHGDGQGGTWSSSSWPAGEAVACSTEQGLAGQHVPRCPFDKDRPVQLMWSAGKEADRLDTDA